MDPILLSSTAAFLSDIGSYLVSVYENQWVAEIFGGVFTSLLFLGLLSWLRPKIDISPHISRSTKDGETLYKVKIINKSRRKLLDIKLELIMFKPVGVSGGKNLKMKHLKITPDNVWYLSSYVDTEKERKKKKKSNEYAPHAMLATIKEDLAEIWQDESCYLTLKVAGRHGFSGFFTIEKEEYHGYDTVIKDGSFRWGSTFDIV